MSSTIDIYLAAPYHHTDPAVSAARARAVAKVAARLMREGYTVFSPLSHSHPIAEFAPHESHEFWMRQDLAVLAACRALYVLKLPGVEKSRGVEIEETFALRAGKQVVYCDPRVMGLSDDEIPQA